jgi:hypothetical protein
MQHIERVVWKPINWFPESPDQYEGGVPPPKPESLAVELSDGCWWLVTGLQMGGSVDVYEITGETELHEWPNGQVTRHVPCGRVPDEPLFSLPADRVTDVVNALLYVHRRTHEHEYEEADWSEDLPGENDDEA